MEGGVDVGRKEGKSILEGGIMKKIGAVVNKR